MQNVRTYSLPKKDEGGDKGQTQEEELEEKEQAKDPDCVTSG